MKLYKNKDHFKILKFVSSIMNKKECNLKTVETKLVSFNLFCKPVTSDKNRFFD